MREVRSFFRWPKTFGEFVGKWLVIGLFLLIPPFTPYGIIALLLLLNGLFILPIVLGIFYAFGGGLGSDYYEPRNH